MRLKSFIKKNLHSFYAQNIGHLSLFITLALFLYLVPSGLLLNSSLPTGGDHPGHFYNLNTTLETLNLRNWNPNNLAGEVLNGHYFPMSFILLSLFSYLIGPLLSYKLFLLFSLFSIPLLIYFLLLKRTKNPQFASLALFLSFIINFYSNNFNWGLSAFSSLIGLISHQLAFFFFLLFIDRLFFIKNFKKLDIKTLFFIIGTALAHPYIAINIPIVFLVFFYYQENKKTFFFFTLKCFLFSIAISAWWLFPMLYNLEDNSSFSFQAFYFLKWKNFFSPSILIFIIFIGFYLFIAKKKESLTIKSQHTTLIISLFLFNLLCLFIFPLIGLVDIRVLGFLFYCFFTFIFLSTTKLKNSFLSLLTILLLIAFIPFNWTALKQTKTMLESSFKGPFHAPRTIEIITSLQKIIQEENLNNQNRLAYEYNPMFLWQFGSDRFFETLTAYINKPNFDGLYIQANQYSKYAHYFQSLLGLNNQCLKNDYCSETINLEKASELMPILGIDTILLTSFHAQKEALISKRFFDKIITLPFGTLLIKRNISTVSVNSSKISNSKKWKNEYFHSLQKSPLSLTSKEECHAEVQAKFNQITLKTECPDKPHILKYMYSKDLSSDALHFKAPYGYIGIIPKEKITVLKYGKNFSFILAQWISLIGLVVLICNFIWNLIEIKKGQ